METASQGINAMKRSRLTRFAVMPMRNACLALALGSLGWSSLVVFSSGGTPMASLAQATAPLSDNGSTSKDGTAGETTSSDARESAGEGEQRAGDAAARDGGAAGDWPRFLGHHYDGRSSLEGEAIDWTSRPEFHWSLDVGEGYGMGTVVGDRYYQFDGTLDRRARAREERLRCVDLRTGETLWTQTQPLFYRDLYGYEAGPRSSPTVAGDRIFTFGVAGRLTCRDRSDGSELWSVDTQEKYGVVQNFFGVACSPLVLGDAVIVMVGGSPPEDAEIAPGRLDRVSPDGSAVVAFDRHSGQELWKTGDDLASYSSPRPVQVDGKTLVLVFARSGLMAIDPADGTVCWTFGHRADKVESVNAMMPVVDGNRVFISECYGVGSALLRISSHDCEVVWRDSPGDRRAQAMRCHWSTPALVDGYLYGCSGRNAPDSDFRCVDFDTGEVMWVAPWRERSSVTQVGDLLVVMRERGSLEVIRPTPEKLKVVAQWPMAEKAGERPALRHPCWAAPVVVDQRCLIRGDRQVLCLELAAAK